MFTSRSIREKGRKGKERKGRRKYMTFTGSKLEFLEEKRGGVANHYFTTGNQRRGEEKREGEGKVDNGKGDFGEIATH